MTKNTAAGRTVTDNKEMAEIMNSYFSTVFTRENGQAPEATNVDLNTRLSDVEITEKKVRDKLKKLRPSSAPGPDSIGAGLLQELEDEVAPALTVLYRRLLDSGFTPGDWKKANVSPIFKKGAKRDPANYRPVSLTSVCCKVFESILRDAIMTHLDTNNVISDNQHGFRSAKSCATNLVEFYDRITDALNKLPADVVFLDMAKAFDKVPTRALLNKLKACGVTGKVGRWIENWLTGRQMRVTINGQASTWTEVLSGVPQGSVLGPILFIIFINDLEQAAGGAGVINMFADDTKVGAMMKTDEDVAQLQSALEGIYNWSQKWGMPFNVAKCKVMHTGRRNTKPQYTMGGQVLITTELEKDVGVMVTPNLKPAAHCAKAARTASTVLGQISRTFSYRDKHTFLSLYVQFVRPHMEFASQAWSPWHQKDINILEKVQERAVKMIGGLKGSSYSEKLKELGLQSLQERRDEADLLLAYKVINKRCNVDSSKWFKMRETGPRATRAGDDNLRMDRPRTRLELRENFYTVRVTEKWNDLPYKIRAEPTVQRFKAALRRHVRAHAEGDGRADGP